MNDKIKSKGNNEISLHYAKELITLNIESQKKYAKNYKFNYNYLLKNILSDNEICPKCLHEMQYEKLKCLNCDFDFKDIGYDEEDFQVMQIFINFINSHEKLKNQVRELLEINIDENDLLDELYKCIYFDDSLKKDFKDNNLNDYFNLDEHFEHNYISLSNNKNFDKYALNHDGEDSISIDLLQYQLLLAIEEYKDMNLALLSLNDVPIFLKDAIKRLIIEEGFITNNVDESDGDYIQPIQNELISKISEHNIFLTKKAREFLNDNDWINFYVNFLYHFDFSDFSNYYMNHNGDDINDISSKYLQKHFQFAKKDLNFNYLLDCLKTQSKISQNIGDFKNTLLYEMRIFCLNINPICLDIDSFPSFKPLDEDNINKLSKLKSKLGDKYFSKQFNENWNFLGFNSSIIFKNDALRILKESLNSLDLNEVNESVKWNYFEKFYE